MDVLETLKLHMNYIVECIFNNVGNDEEKVLDEMYSLICSDISINFDSKCFYLLKYEMLDISKLYFNIDYEKTPKDLLKMIINLIELRRMEQNIKNKSYLIHFRVFKGKVYLEDKSNTLRVEAYLQLHNYFRQPFMVRLDLIKRLLNVRNKLRTPDDIEESEIINYKVQEYRIIAILKAIEERTALLL
jgi:hypothetical protein